MINGKAGEFVDRIYTCQDTVFIYNGIKYWFQRYMPDANSVHMEIFKSIQMQMDMFGYMTGTLLARCSLHFKRHLFLMVKPFGK